MIGWVLDTDLEESIAMSILPDEDQVRSVLEYIWRIRESAERKSLDVIISTRAVMATLRLLKAGMEHDDALAIALHNKLDKRTRNILGIGE